MHAARQMVDRTRKEYAKKIARKTWCKVATGEPKADGQECTLQDRGSAHSLLLHFLLSSGLAQVADANAQKCRLPFSASAAWAIQRIEV